MTRGERRRLRRRLVRNILDRIPQEYVPPLTNRHLIRLLI